MQGAVVTFAARVMACVVASIGAAAAASAAPSGQTITCPYANDPDEHLTIVAPARIGDLPPIDFDYPAKVTRFSFRDGHLLVIAMDQDERSRVRIVISAQLNKATRTY